MNKRLEQAINEQINAEIWSAYLYLSMSGHFASEGFSGIANWFKVQWQEELAHAMKFFDYLIERGSKPELKPIKEVQTKWDSPLHAFEETLKHEKEVTRLINNLMDIAIEEKDHATKGMLQWFVDEQVEEEANVQEILDTLKLINGNGNGLFMLDKELKQRTFVNNTQAKK